MKFLKYFNSSKQNFLIWTFAFLFASTSFILSFFDLVQIQNFDNSTGVLSGIDLFFGAHFNAFSLIGWITLLVTIIGLIIYVFYKKTRVLQCFSALIAVLLFGFLPFIVNQPLPENPEINLFASAGYTGELISIIVLSGLSFILMISLNLEDLKFSVREICELAMLIGLAVVLNFFPKIPLSWAGSINFQIVPLVIIALRFSPLKTFMSCGLIFGVITCLTDGYGYFAFPLEYLLAFGSVAIISPFRHFILKYRTENKHNYVFAIITLMSLILVQTVIRFLCASIDSYIFYYAYLDLSTASTAFGAALIYNAPYVFLTGVATMGVVGVLYYPLLRINKRFSNR